jgi:hypothetical protein
VGRYEAGAGPARQVWTLAGDGTCRIERAEAVRACEWHLRLADGRMRLVVTTVAGAHTTTWVLNPRRWPWGAVTLPLGPGEGQELRKVG